MKEKNTKCHEPIDKDNEVKNVRSTEKAQIDEMPNNNKNRLNHSDEAIKDSSKDINNPKVINMGLFDVDKELDEFLKSNVDDSFGINEEIEQRISSKLEARIRRLEGKSNTEEINNEKNNANNNVKNNVKIENENKNSNGTNYENLNVSSISDIRDEQRKRRGVFYKMNKNVKRIVAAMGVVVLLGAGTAAVNGNSFFTVEKELKSGRLSIEVDKLNVEPKELHFRLSDEVKGKLFDKNGNELKELTAAQRDVYDKDGNKLNNIKITENGKVVLDKEDEIKVNYKYFKTVEEAMKHLDFTPRIIKGLEVENVEMMQDKGELASEYVTINQKYGNGIIEVSERKGTDENAYEGDARSGKAVKVLGKDAILINNNTVLFDNVDSYISVSYKGGTIPEKELIKLANELVKVEKK